METSRLDKPTINIFEMLKLRREPYHNTMLAWLLDPDPDQNHGLDDAFLSRFLERVGVENYTRDDFQDIQAEYTLRTADGSTTCRLDIFIETRNHKVYIENKVSPSAIDDQQLEEQARCVRDNVGDKKGIHVFIVPRRRDIRSSTQAIVDENDIRTLEWSELVKLLEDIASKEDADPHVRVILEQYRNYVKEYVTPTFEGFSVEGMRKYVEAAEVIWQLEKGESPKRQVEKFLTIVAEEVLSQLPGEVSSEWDFRIKEDRSWAPVSWAVCFTSEDYSGLKFPITIWYDSPADGLLRASVGVAFYCEHASQLAKIVYEYAKALGTVQCYEEGTYYELWEEDVVQWSDLEQWQSFRDRLIRRTVVWMTELIPVIEERLQPLQKERRAKKRSTAPR
jgi:hypothetical protein